MRPGDLVRIKTGFLFDFDGHIGVVVSDRVVDDYYEILLPYLGRHFFRKKNLEVLNETR